MTLVTSNNLTQPGSNTRLEQKSQVLTLSLVTLKKSLSVEQTPEEPSMGIHKNLQSGITYLLIPLASDCHVVQEYGQHKNLMT